MCGSLGPCLGKISLVSDFLETSVPPAARLSMDPIGGFDSITFPLSLTDTTTKWCQCTQCTVVYWSFKGLWLSGILMTLLSHFYHLKEFLQTWSVIAFAIQPYLIRLPPFERTNGPRVPLRLKKKSSKAGWLILRAQQIPAFLDVAFLKNLGNNSPI